MSDVGVLRDLARARRSRRLQDVDIFEKLYQAYLSVIAVGVVVLAGAGLVGDDRLGHSAVARAASDGPAIVGIVATLVLVAGLRSGMRGGPLTLEPAFVSHVLLSPVGRDEALREPAIRQLRTAALGGGGVGALGGLLASHRLPLTALPLMVWGAVAFGSVAVAATGLAMVVAGFPVRRAVARTVAVVLVAGSVTDLVAGTAWSPGSIVGRLATNGVRFDAVGLAAVAFAPALAAAGVAVVGGTSIEAARRRAGLVSQLRMAVTRQDLRTVVLLQRRLAQDAARRRPWLRVPGGERLPVFRRDLRGLARLPLVRVLRVVVLCSVAVGAAVAAWQGTTPLVLVTGVATWAAALDVIEPLAQELDHPDRWAGYPVVPGDLLVRHLVAPGIALAVAFVPAVTAAAIAGDASTVLQVAGALGLPLCAAAVIGAASSIATAPFDISSSAQTMMPETVGMQLIFRMAWPPALAVLAALPLLGARHAVEQRLSAIAGATQFLLPLCVLIGAVSVWLSRRKPVRS